MYKKHSLESSETPVLYRGRTCLKVKPDLTNGEPLGPFHMQNLWKENQIFHNRTTVGRHPTRS